MKSRIIEFIENVENLKFDQEQAPSSYFSISSSVDYLPRIGFIDEGSIADLAGLKKGDIILGVNSNKAFSIYQTNELLNEYGKQLSLLLKEITIYLQLICHPKVKECHMV